MDLLGYKNFDKFQNQLVRDQWRGWYYVALRAHAFESQREKPKKSQLGWGVPWLGGGQGCSLE